MIDKNSGRIIELAKGTSVSAIQLGQCFAMITSLCHFISSRDIAKQLTEVARNLSLLSAARCTDQDAMLHRIYTEAREILGRKKIDCPAVLRLRNKRYDLYELRQRWCGDISVLLRSTAIPDQRLLRPSRLRKKSLIPGKCRRKRLLHNEESTVYKLVE